MKNAHALLIASFFVFPILSKSQGSVDFKIENTQKKKALYEPQLEKNAVHNPFKLAKALNQEKNISEIKQVLDSMGTFDNGDVYEKEKYTYNTNGQCILNERFTLDESSELTNFSKTRYTYWPNNMVRKLQNQIWRVDLNDWMNFIKIEFAYNDNLLIESQVFGWDVDINEWDITTKDIYEYDDENRLIYSINKKEDSGNWENYEKEAFSYHDNNDLYLWIAFGWIDENWMPSVKREHFFDNLDNQNLIISSDWIEDTEDWLHFYKNEYIYNADNQRIMALYSFFDTEDSQWHNQYKDEYAKDEYDNRIQEIDYIWENESWLKISKDEWVYNYSFPANELILPNSNSYSHTHMLSETKSFHWDGSWYPWTNDVLYYSPKDINGLEVFSAVRVNIYPNPNLGVFKVEISDVIRPSTISIISFSGQIILQEEISDFSTQLNKTYDLSTYAKGVYLLRVFNSSESSSFKIAVY